MHMNMRSIIFIYSLRECPHLCSLLHTLIAISRSALFSSLAATSSLPTLLYSIFFITRQRYIIIITSLYLYNYIIIIHKRHCNIFYKPLEITSYNKRNAIFIYAKKYDNIWLNENIYFYKSIFFDSLSYKFYLKIRKENLKIEIFWNRVYLFLMNLFIIGILSVHYIIIFNFYLIDYF